MLYRLSKRNKELLYIYVCILYRLSKRNEELLSQENHQLSEELTMKRDDCDGLNRKLDQKVTIHLDRFYLLNQTVD
jgi:hypothetical protein